MTDRFGTPRRGTVPANLRENLPGTNTPVRVENLRVHVGDFGAMLAEATRHAEADPANEYLAGVVAALRWVGELTVTTPFTNTTRGAMPAEARAAERAVRAPRPGASRAQALGVYRALRWAGTAVSLGVDDVPPPFASTWRVGDGRTA